MSSPKSIFAVLVAAAVLAASAADAAIPGPVDVNVVNTPARQPFMITRSCITNGQHYCAIPAIPVPADKVLVIEHVSMNGWNDYHEQAAMQISVKGGINDGANFWVPAVLMADGRSWLSESLRLYADAGTDVRLSVVFASAANGGVAISLSGYLVDCATEFLCGVP